MGEYIGISYIKARGRNPAWRREGVDHVDERRPENDQETTASRKLTRIDHIPLFLSHTTTSHIINIIYTYNNRSSRVVTIHPKVHNLESIENLRTR